MRRLINRIERAILRCYEFASNVSYYYFERRNSLRDAIEPARITLP